MVGAADGDPVGGYQTDAEADSELAGRVPQQAAPPDGGLAASHGAATSDADSPGLGSPAGDDCGLATRLASPSPAGLPEPAAAVGAPGPVPGASRGRSRRAGVCGAVARGVADLLITLGLVVGLFLAYELWITDIFQARSQSRLHGKLAATWATPARPATPSRPPPPVPLHPSVGQGFAELHIPRLGADYEPVIVEGVGEAQLEEGPGHYPGTAMPGKIGNFVVSGHRTTYGKPFNRLDELHPRDPVVVEVSDRYYVYRVTRSEVVAPTRLDVTYPVPERAGKTPTAAVMTMTTCNPKYSAKTRLIVFAALDRTVMKTPGVGVPFEGGEG